VVHFEVKKTDLHTAAFFGRLDNSHYHRHRVPPNEIPFHFAKRPNVTSMTGQNRGLIHNQYSLRPMPFCFE
jgi:hypothetical protein